MSLTRSAGIVSALRVPWSFTSLVFVALSAPLLALFLGKGVLGVFGAYFILSWLFKYSYVVLEHVANGAVEAPVVSAEMLGPFEQRPLVQVAWCVVLFATARALGGSVGAVLTGVLLLVLPASVAILGMKLGLLQSLNPIAIWRTVRGLGVYYLGILALMAGTGGLIFMMASMGAWSALTIAVAEMAVLTVFSVIGGALFERRLELGHEPIVSPERQLERDDREHLRRLNAMLDEIYTHTRMRRAEQALELLRNWFAQLDERRTGADAHTILQRVETWGNAEAVKAVALFVGGLVAPDSQPEDKRGD